MLMYKSILAAFALLLLAPMLLLGQARPEKGTDAPTEVGGRKIDQWLAELKHPDASRRTTAVEIVPLFGENAKKFVPALIDRTRDKDTSPRISSVLALGFIPIADKDKPKVIDALTARIIPKNETQSAVRLTAVLSLSRFADEAQRAIPVLQDAARDMGSWKIRQAAIRVLVQASRSAKDPADKRATQTLLTVLKSEMTSSVRTAAIQGLGAMGTHPDQPLHQQVVLALYNQANHRSADGKALTVNKPLAIWAYTALVGLEKNQSSVDAALKNIAKFLEAKGKDGRPEVEVRLTAINSLGGLGKKAISQTGALLPLLEDSEPFVVHTVCQALAVIGDKSARVMTALEETLKHEHHQCVTTAASALFQLGDPPARIISRLERIAAMKDAGEERVEFLKKLARQVKKFAEEKK